MAGIRNLHVTPELMLRIAKGKYEVIHNPLPEDVKVAGANYDHHTQCFVITLFSEEYSRVSPGAPIPEVESPVIRRLE